MNIKKLYEHCQNGKSIRNKKFNAIIAKAIDNQTTFIKDYLTILELIHIKYKKFCSFDNQEIKIKIFIELHKLFNKLNNIEIIALLKKFQLLKITHKEITTEFNHTTLVTIIKKPSDFFDMIISRIESDLPTFNSIQLYELLQILFNIGFLITKNDLKIKLHSAIINSLITQKKCHKDILQSITELSIKLPNLTLETRNNLISYLLSNFYFADTEINDIESSLTKLEFNITSINEKLLKKICVVLFANKKITNVFQTLNTCKIIWENALKDKTLHDIFINNIIPYLTSKNSTEGFALIKKLHEVKFPCEYISNPLNSFISKKYFYRKNDTSSTSFIRFNNQKNKVANFNKYMEDLIQKIDFVDTDVKQLNKLLENNIKYISTLSQANIKLLCNNLFLNKDLLGILKLIKSFNLTFQNTKCDVSLISNKIYDYPADTQKIILDIMIDCHLINFGNMDLFYPTIELLLKQDMIEVLNKIFAQHNCNDIFNILCHIYIKLDCIQYNIKMQDKIQIEVSYQLSSSNLILDIIPFKKLNNNTKISLFENLFRNKDLIDALNILEQLNADFTNIVLNLKLIPSKIQNYDDRQILKSLDIMRKNQILNDENIFLFYPRIIALNNYKTIYAKDYYNSLVCLQHNLFDLTSWKNIWQEIKQCKTSTQFYEKNNILSYKDPFIQFISNNCQNIIINLNPIIDGYMFDIQLPNQKILIQLYSEVQDITNILDKQSNLKPEYYTIININVDKFYKLNNNEKKELLLKLNIPCTYHKLNAAAKEYIPTKRSTSDPITKPESHQLKKHISFS